MIKANSQGNHIIYRVSFKGVDYLLRLENGPENDSYMEVESAVTDEVRRVGVPTPKIYEIDATRTKATFSCQIMNFVSFPDLNTLNKTKQLELPSVAIKLGEYLAQWQTIEPKSFGPFNVVALRAENKLVGLHASYRDYFLTNWHKHLNFLYDNEFFTYNEIQEIRDLVEDKGL